MANIQKRPNGKWRARYRDLDGKKHARHFERKLDVQRWLDEVTAGMVTGQYVDPRASSVTFEKYAEKWEGSPIAGEAGERITDNEDRTRSVMDAVLGGLRTGCGQVGDVTSETAGQTA